MPYYALIADIISRIRGALYFHDQLSDRSMESRDIDEIVDFLTSAQSPWLDLVTDEGEAIGFFLAGDPEAVDPRPSFDVDGGMVYMVKGTPIAGQTPGKSMVPLAAFLGADKTLDMNYAKFTTAQLDISTAASMREITLMAGRSRQEAQGKWKPRTSTFGQFSDILQNHLPGEKDGACYLQGESADGARKSSAQIANHILGVDLDSGAPLGDVMATIQKHGLEAVIYTTHSHLKDTSEIKRDHFMKKMGASDASDIELVKQYLIEWKGVLPAIVDRVVVLDDAKHTAEGVVILVRHNPMPKFRAVFALDEPFVFAKRGGSQQDAINEWKERYAGFCTDMGFFFDEKCVDPARLFYLPRHKKDDTTFGSWLIVGEPLNLDKFSRVKLNRKRKTGAPVPNNPFSQAGAGAGDDDDTDRHITEGGFNLRHWGAKYAKRFEIETMLDQVVGGDFIREARQSGKPGVHVECPFEAEHSSFGGGGTFVVNAGDNFADGYEGGFTFNCQHNACSGRDRLDFLKELLDQEVISTDDLTNKYFLLDLEDEISHDHRKPDPFAMKSSIPGMLGEDEVEHFQYFDRRYAFVIGKKGLTIVREPAQPGGEISVMSERNLVLLERNRGIWREDAQGKLKRYRAIDAWLDSDQRRIFENGMDFYPGGNAPGGVFNTFTGFPIPARTGGSCELLKQHLLNNVCEGNWVWYDYFWTWIADIIQNPGRKAGVAVILTGLKGTGKSKPFEYLLDLLGRYALKVTHSKAITGNFNAHQQGKLFMLADEAVCVGDSHADGLLKDLITSQRMHAEGKGRDAETATNFMRLAIVSNEEQVVRATQDERRFFALRCGEGNMQDHDFFRAMDQQMQNGGLEALMHELSQHKPKGGWDTLFTPPVTPYLRAQQAYNRNVIDQFIVELIREEGYEIDGGDSIALREDRATEVTLLELRTAWTDYAKLLPPSQRVRAGFPELRAAATRMAGAVEYMRPVSGGVNRTSLLVFPPLKGVRDYLKREHAVELDMPPELPEDGNENVFALSSRTG